MVYPVHNLVVMFTFYLIRSSSCSPGKVRRKHVSKFEKVKAHRSSVSYCTLFTFFCRLRFLKRRSRVRKESGKRRLRRIKTRLISETQTNLFSIFNISSLSFAAAYITVPICLIYIYTFFMYSMFCKSIWIRNTFARFALFLHNLFDLDSESQLY